MASKERSGRDKGPRTADRNVLLNGENDSWLSSKSAAAAVFPVTVQKSTMVELYAFLSLIVHVGFWKEDKDGGQQE